MSLAKLIDLPIHGDDRGQLIAIEGSKTIAFDIRRVYFMYQTGEGVRRGLHAHRKLRQLAVCVNGSCSFLLDDGVEVEEVRLDRPDQGLLIEKMVWREMFDFSPDAILMVLADEHYCEDDYIRSRMEFERLVKSKINHDRRDF
jgi:dTDP-4-dehydrorhamnose 3,5-epimerase-like enzyme